MAADFALVALPGAYHSSVGALTDSFMLARERIEHLFTDPDPIRMETRLRVLSADGAPVALSDGTLLPAEGAFDADGPFAFIWLPSFQTNGRQALADRIANARPLLEWLRQRADEGAVVGASGSASMLLMAAGFTNDIPVPVGRALRPLVRAMFPRQPLEDRFGLVDHGDLLIANGFANDLNLIIRVMDRMLSPDIARWLTSIMGLDNDDESLLAPDAMVAQAQLWIEQRFTTAINIADLATHLSTSSATLNRRFHKTLGLSPKAYVNQLRFRSAIRMLEKSARSIDMIAQLVGYSDSRLFRAMFRQQAGMTASQWREAYHAARKTAG